MKRLLFDKNKIRGASAATFAGFLGRNETQTESINVGDNLISDTSVSHFVDSLQENTELKQLNIRQNRLTDKGKREMTKVVLDATDVASIVRSNHTCNLVLGGESSAPVNLAKEMAMISINADLGLSIDQRIREKVVFALCDKPAILSSLLYYLDESPLGLVPHVLALIQEGQKYYQCIEVDNLKAKADVLSRLFLALKGWKMPELFENVPDSPKVARRKKKRDRSR